MSEGYMGQFPGAVFCLMSFVRDLVFLSANRFHHYIRSLVSPAVTQVNRSPYQTT